LPSTNFDVTALTAKRFESPQTFLVTLFRNRYRVEAARLADWDYRSGGWYFVTICTKNRQCLLGRITDGALALTAAGIIAENEMRNISGHYNNVTVDRFIVMPNHVHAIVVIEGEHAYSPKLATVGDAASCVSTDERTEPTLPRRLLSGSLSAIVRGYKSGVSRICCVQGIQFQWQPRFHDHMLRSNAAVDAVRDYIERNPENWWEDPDNPDETQR
jgi:REP-associated tyrosine transposase